MAHLHNFKQKAYTCIHCGNSVRELYKKFSNTVKMANCDKCHRIADNFIEFEPVIILVDAVLLSEPAFRHMLYNRNFKLHWKLSLVLLLLESFALWRKKRADIVELAQYDLVHEKGFYFCCLQNIFDYFIITFILFSITLLQRDGYAFRKSGGLHLYILLLLKAIIIANFSKFFLLPIMVWRDNTTELGANIHHLLVLGHHLCSMTFVFAVISGYGKLQAALAVLPTYLAKEYLKRCLSTYMEVNF